MHEQLGGAAGACKLCAQCRAMILYTHDTVNRARGRTGGLGHERKGRNGAFRDCTVPNPPLLFCSLSLLSCVAIDPNHAPRPCRPAASGAPVAPLAPHTRLATARNGTAVRPPGGAWLRRDGAARADAPAPRCSGAHAPAPVGRACRLSQHSRPHTYRGFTHSWHSMRHAAASPLRPANACVASPLPSRQTTASGHSPGKA